MNDAELNRLLKSARVPDRPAAFWEHFPGRVVASIQRVSPASARVSHWRPRLAWSLGVAAICLLVGFAIGHWRAHEETTTADGVLQNARVIAEMMDMFPNRLRAIVQDDQGLHLVLADQPTVPSSSPLWVRVCESDHCLTLVTFSGQQLQIAGQQVTVLSDAKGGVILMGDEFAWASAQPGLAPANLQIQAKPIVLAAK